ncbi:sugar/nucleoside kinase (ribokinase family) [Kibdelosporangium banguiense]|uniref:Sugar/nucleoside kinase (Ribokinase family) n=1 Tax=Kibdelosporangium banguiense TaxID=1365924 RepID=A0ABS4TDT7_9PSEU|nr:sugar/nucleoside kinase (ribokinase family) [Kibdelosporangium banguiense]
MDDLPVPGQKVQSSSVELVAGGPAANAAITIAALGGQVRLVTVLGAHPLADLARRDLEQYGVEVVDAVPDRAEPPAVSAVSVRIGDGERTVVSHNASGSTASAAINLSDVDTVLLDGHHPGLALAAAKAEVPVILDAGSRKPVFEDLLPQVDVCACSSAFTDPVDCPVITRTHGPDPVQWFVGDERGAVPVPEVQAKDTSGAGDVWHGALTLGVARLGHVPKAADMPELIAFANRIAGVRVQHEGASWRARLR